MRRALQMVQQQQGQKNPQQQLQLQTKGSSPQKPQKQQSQLTSISSQQKLKQQPFKQIMASDQKKPQQQSQQTKGVANRKPKIHVFDYQQFILIMEQGLQNQEDQDVNSQQQLLHRYRCMVVNHNKNTIECICVNLNCMMENRRICFDCIIQKLHDKDMNEQNQQCNQPLNADQLNNVIKNYKFFLNQQIDFIEYFFYFELLELTNENNEKIACIRLQELCKLVKSIKYLKYTMDQVNIKDYIEQQYNNNIGIFNYFLQYQEEIYIINQNIQNYEILKNETKNSSPYIIQYVKIDIDDKEMLEKNKSKKKDIIINLIQTSKYKNQEIDERDLNFIKSQIEEICILGTVLLQQKQFELAIICYDIQIQSNPNDAKNSDYFYQKGQIYDYDLGICLANLQRDEEAIHMFDKAIQLNPQKSDYYFNIGEKYQYHLGYQLANQLKYEEAIQMFDKAISLHPYDSDYHFNLAKQDQYDFGNSLINNLYTYEEAIQLFDNAIHLNPQDSDYYFNKGKCLHNLQRFEEADEMFDKAIHLNSQDSDNYFNKGKSLNNLQRYEEAIHMFDQAIKLNPLKSDYYFNKGKSLHNLQRYEEAIQKFDRSISIRQIQIIIQQFINYFKYPVQDKNISNHIIIQQSTVWLDNGKMRWQKEIYKKCYIKYKNFAYLQNIQYQKIKKLQNMEGIQYD